jgi:acetyl esterase/lipase
MTSLFRGMDKAALDAAYNNSLAVKDSAAWMADFDTRSESVRARPGAVLGLRYGPSPRNLIDYFAADGPGPLVIFIHGGYWQMRAKESFSFIAEGLNQRGLHVALVGYTLAPDATLGGIVQEVKNAIAYLQTHAAAHGGDPARLLVSGWSAGGHLTALCLDEPGVVGGLAISGIYDLEPMRLCYINDKLGLAPQDVTDLSPMQLTPSDKPLVVAFGDAELPELQRQSQAFFERRQAAGKPGALLPLDGLNHFSILDALGDPQSPLVDALCQLAA